MKLDYIYRKLQCIVITKHASRKRVMKFKIMCSAYNLLVCFIFHYNFVILVTVSKTLLLVFKHQIFKTFHKTILYICFTVIMFVLLPLIHIPFLRIFVLIHFY
jgi:hypothetical protein